MAQANIKAVITAEDRASATLRKFAHSTDSMSSSIATGLKRVAIAAGAATTAIGVLAIHQFRDIQKNVAGIQALTANTEEAKKVLNDVISFVKGKPFDRLETLGAAKQLLAFGRTAQDVKGDLDILGRTVIISGIDWNNLTRVYGRVISSGKLLREDFNILNDAGVGLAKALQKNLGLSMEQVFERMREGKISAEDFKKALETAAPSTAVKNAMNTLDNKFISLKASIRDVAFQILGVDFNELSDGAEPLVKPGGILDRLTDGMDKFVAYLRSPQFQEGLRKFADWLTVNIPPAINYVTQTLIPSLVNIFKTIWPAIQTTAKIFGEALKFISEQEWIIWALVGAFGALRLALFIEKAVAAFSASMAAVRAVATLTTASIGGITKAVGLLRAGLLVPMVMPAIAVGAALAALGLVIAKAIETKRVVEESRRNIENSTAIAKRSIDGLIARALIGNAHAQKVLAQQGIRSVAVPNVPQFASGGFTGPGGANQIAGVVHKGEYVIPQSGVDQRTGLPKTGGGVNITIQAGAFMGSEVEARKFANQILSHLKDIAASKGTTLNRMMA